MLRPGLALLSILLAVPASAGSHFHGGGFHGQGSHGQGSHGQGFHGFHGGGAHDGDFAFHRSIGRGRNLFVVYGNCGFGFDCGVYDPGYAYGYGGGAGNSVSSSDGSSSSGDNGGGYVPDPVGAEIPPVIFPTQCWVRRAGYDPSGAYVGQVLIDLCHRSDSVTVNRVEARAKPPNTGSGAPQSPR